MVGDAVITYFLTSPSPIHILCWLGGTYTFCSCEKLQEEHIHNRVCHSIHPHPFPSFQTHEWGLPESKCFSVTYTLYIEVQTHNNEGDSAKRWVLDKQKSLLQIHPHSTSQSHGWCYINPMNEYNMRLFQRREQKDFHFFYYVRTQKPSMNKTAHLMTKLLVPQSLLPHLWNSN